MTRGSSSPMKQLQQAFDALKEAIVYGTAGSGLEVRVAMVDMSCGFEPDEKGRLEPRVRTNRMSEGDAPHRLQLALTVSSDPPYEPPPDGQ